MLITLWFSYALPMDHQLSPSSESDNYDKKPYSESEHSTTSCFSSCKYIKYVYYFKLKNK